MHKIKMIDENGKSVTKKLAVNYISGGLSIGFTDTTSGEAVNRNINIQLNLPLDNPEELEKVLRGNPLLGSQNLLKFIKEALENSDLSTVRAREFKASMGSIFSATEDTAREKPTETESKK